MAFALVLAAGIGAAAGLIWHASGFGDDPEEVPAGQVAAD